MVCVYVFVLYTCMESVFIYLCVYIIIHLLKGAALNVQASVIMHIYTWPWHVLVCTHVYFLGLGALTGFHKYMLVCQGMSRSNMFGYIHVLKHAGGHTCIYFFCVEEWLCSVYMCVFTYECAHVSKSLHSQACGLPGAIVDPGHFCPHGMSVCMNVSVHVYTDMGKRKWASGWGCRYFPIPKNKLRSMESPLSPAPLLPYPLSLPIHPFSPLASPLWAPSLPVFHPLSISLISPSASPSVIPSLIYLRALLPTPPMALPLPATPLHSAGDSLPVSSTESSNTILPPGLHFWKPHSSYFPPPFAPPPQSSLQFASE